MDVEYYHRIKALGGHLELRKFMHIHYLRLATFLTWPASGRAFTTILASAGFFYMGSGDEVECFSCRRKISQWTWLDIPMARHRDIYPDCDFINGRDTTNEPYDPTYVESEHLSQNSNIFAKVACLLENLHIRKGSSHSAREENENSNTEMLTSADSDIFQTPMRDTSSFETNNYSSTLRENANVIQNNENLIIDTTRNFADEDSYRQQERENLKHESNRLKTFDENWPEDNPVSPSDLANSGFYYTGILDRVQCVFCLLVLSRWEVGDVPVEEHKRYRPQCPYISGLSVGNVPIKRQIQTSSHNYRSAKYPQYSSLVSRLQSFKFWPSQMHQKPEQLASAGFFYTDDADNVKCYSCGGGLRTWLPNEDPWIEHARHFPKCDFVRKIKGEDFIQRTLEMYQTSNSEKDANEPLAGATGGQTTSCEETDTIVKHLLEMGYSIDTIKETIEIKKRSKDTLTVENIIQDIVELKQKSSHEVSQITDTPSDRSSTLHGNKKKTSKGKGNRKTKSKASKKLPTENVQDPRSGRSSPKEEVDELLKEKQSLKMIIEEQRDRRTCKICMDDDANILFLPCGHIAACKTCAPALLICPICRMKIKGTVNIFLT